MKAAMVCQDVYDITSRPEEPRLLLCHYNFSQLYFGIGQDHKINKMVPASRREGKAKQANAE